MTVKKIRHIERKRNIPPDNRQINNTVVSDLIAPLKKAQRKSEGGQLFPVNAERANLLARVCERRY